MKNERRDTKTKVRHADIAREADVGIATVDRVLNGRPGVRPHTAQRIWDAMHRLESGGVDSAKPAKIAKARLNFDFILPGGPNAFWELIEGAVLTASEQVVGDGVGIRTHLIEGFDPQGLVDRIRLIGKETDGLVIVALENPMVREAVTQCHDAGIPVVTIVSDLLTPKKAGYVGLDNRAAGRTAGYLMGRLLHKRKGKVALFEGSLDLFYRDHQERDLGFRDVLRELFPDLTVAVRTPTHDDHEKAYLRTCELLHTHPDVLGIYNVGGGIRGNARALQESGRADDVVLIGHELTPYSRQFLIDGTLDAVIDQNPLFQVQEAIRVLMACHQDGMGTRALQVPRIEVFFRENLP